MGPIAFGAIYLGSWLLMGLGVFLAFRVTADLRRAAGARGSAWDRYEGTSHLLRAALLSLVLLVSVGVTYAGAYTFYNLMLAP